ncbi:hypothetical protein GCG54_00011451 [Colletotrichum gloeosporioides]|uniref:Tctex-1 family protein n=1 Tax=Colletotrichum gloeosporioides TaxID=474922 RepID=A0A8H4FP36_COLGL|nr:uncharacterized protein GCG54_00011451 [Colletotrichum gloeosporioides]KAF3809255.1 hypothetical protein GCG54_00011451 [Colletotrichum gloeosporioides]
MSAAPTTAAPPVAFNRLKQIATDACQSAIGSAEFYDHAKTEQWNSAIIVGSFPFSQAPFRGRSSRNLTPWQQSSVLKAVISESTPQGGSAPAYKFACNSTIVQHLVPTSSLNKSKGTTANSEEPHISTSAETTGTDGKPHVGRRGMHSATGAYWDEKKDGMWSYKYDGGEGKGMDVVIMLIWVAI